MKQLSLLFLIALLFSFEIKSQTDISLSYTSFLGGQGFDIPEAMIFNEDSTAFWLCAGTTSEDAPITSDATFPNFGGLKDAYLARLDLEGNIEFATYLGGEGLQNVYSISPGIDGRVS